MRIEKVTLDKKYDFINFCKKHRITIDDSYLSDHELELFCPVKEHAYIVRDEQDAVFGAASLMMHNEYKNANKARFRILFSESSDQEVYQQLFTSILSHLYSGDYIYIFTNESMLEHRKALQGIGFDIERYIYVLERDNLEITPSKFFNEYSLKTFIPGKDEFVFCQVRNEGFRQLIGYTPMTTDNVSEMMHWDDYLDDGILLLYHKIKPVGVVRTGKDYFKNTHYATVNSLSIIPEYQGKGLGRQLLRASLTRGKEKGLNKGFLCVNAENDQAAKLYEQEGFYKTESFVCYHFIIKN